MIAGFKIEQATISKNIAFQDREGTATNMTIKFAKLFMGTREELRSRKGYLESWRPMHEGITTRQDKIDDINDGKKRRAYLYPCWCPRNRTLKRRIFAEDVIKAYNATTTYEDYYSCVVSKDDRSSRGSTMTFQFFPDMHGPVLMEAIFGTEYRDKLYSPENGLLVSAWVHVDMKTGVVVLVPDVPDDPYLENIRKWQSSEAKERKIRMIDREC